jgi:hypothetical protein
MCERDGRRRTDLMIGAEVPASLDRTEGLVAKIGEPIVESSFDVESAKRYGSDT